MNLKADARFMRTLEFNSGWKRPGRWFGLFLSMAILSAAIICSNTNHPTQNESSTGFVKNLGVSFAPWNPATNRAGDFLFLADQSKVFLEFGAIVGAGDGTTKELPTFEYRIDKDAWVFAIADGIVNRFVYQPDTDDYEIGMRSADNSSWDIGYDHVKNPRVKLRDRVASGDTLGHPGTWSGALGRFEIMINNNDNGLSYCPFCVFDETRIAEYQQAVLRLMQDWEAFKGDTTIYDEEKHVQPGCRMETMKSY